VGGTLGGLAAVAIIVLLSLRRSRLSRRRQTTVPQEQDMDHDLRNVFQLSAQPFVSNGAVQNGSQPFFFGADVPGLPLNVAPRQSAEGIPAAEPLPARHSNASSSLSDAQLGSIHDLLRQGVPIPLVANVMEDMLNRQSTSTVADSARLRTSASLGRISTSLPV
jgi:hypothetical protein